MSKVKARDSTIMRVHSSSLDMIKSQRKVGFELCFELLSRGGRSDVAGQFVPQNRVSYKKKKSFSSPQSSLSFHKGNIYTQDWCIQTIKIHHQFAL